MRALEPREQVAPIELTDQELAWAKRVEVDPDLLQQAHAERVLEGIESTPIRRSVRVQKIRGREA